MRIDRSKLVSGAYIQFPIYERDKIVSIKTFLNSNKISYDCSHNNGIITFTIK